MTSHYQLLGVGVKATQDEIKKAYRKLALQWHPDRNTTDKERATEKFKKIGEAYSILSDPVKRKAYDRGDAAFSNINPFDIFSHFFSERPYARTRTRATTFNVSVGISALCKRKKMKVGYQRNKKCHACNGSRCRAGIKSLPPCPICRGSGAIQNVRSIGFMRFQQSGTCPKCSGEGRIITPAVRCQGCEGRGTQPAAETITIESMRTFDVQPLRFIEMGCYDIRTGTYGDVLIHIKTEGGPEFFLDGRQLFIVREVTLCEALVGFRSIINHPRGEKYTVDVKGPLHHHQILKLPGLGLTRSSDLSVKVRISNAKTPLPGEALVELEEVMLRHNLLPGRGKEVPPDNLESPANATVT